MSWLIGIVSEACEPYFICFAMGNDFSYADPYITCHSILLPPFSLNAAPLLLKLLGVLCIPFMMTVRKAFLSLLSVFAVEAISKNESSPIIGKIPKTGNVTRTAIYSALSPPLLSSSSECDDGCNFDYDNDNAPWASPTMTVLVVIDNSTNVTSTSTIQDQISTYETDVSIVFRKPFGYAEALTIPVKEKVHLTYPTAYKIYHNFVKYTDYTIFLNGTSASSSPLCRPTEIYYRSVFAVPLVEAKGSALSNFQSFFHSVVEDCTRHDLRFNRRPIILAPAAALTITRTSYGSLARSTTAKPSPSATAQNPVTLDTTPVHSHNDLSTSHSDNASPKPTPSQILQPASDPPPSNPIPPQVSQSALDPPPLPTAIPTLVSKPQSADPERPSIQLHVNTPWKFDSTFWNSLETNLPGNPEADSPSPTPVLPAQLEFNGPNSPDLLLEKPATRPVITVGSKPVTANPFLQFVIDGKTLSPGGSAIKVHGTPISLAPFASHVVIGASTVRLASPQPSKLPRLTVDGRIITADGLSRFVIDRQTLRPGGPEITVSGTPISLAASATHVVIAGNTFKLAKSPSPLFTLPGSIITADSESHYLIGGQTLIPGSSIYISGTLISLASSASEVVIGSSTIQLLAPSPLSLPILTVGDQKITANSASQYIIDGQTLAAGSPAITVSGTPISLSPSASNVVIGGNTIPFATAPSTPKALTFGGKTFFPNSASEYVVGGLTITPGAPALTISGTPISLAPSASNIVIGGITITIGGSNTPLPPLTIDGTTILPNSASQYLVGSQTLIPGASAITVSGTRISLALSASALIVGSKTIPLTSGSTPTTVLPLITIGNSVITPNAASQYIIAGQTLVPGGPAITVSGTRISLAPQASDVVVGTSTEGLGRLILAGVGVTAPASVTAPATATGPTDFQGAATRVYGRRWIVAMLGIVWSFWGWL